MGQFYGYETVTNLTKSSTTKAYLPGGFTLKVGGQGFTSASNVFVDCTVSGAGGLDTGTLTWGLYYVYAVYSSGSFYLVMSLSSVAPTGFTTYRQVGALTINSALQVDIVYSAAALNSESILNSKNYLRNNSLVKSTDFSDTSSLYTWPLNGTGSFSGANSFGGLDLTAVGAGFTAATNHLGSTVYNYIAGASSAYAAGTTFDTPNESFTTGGWFKITSGGGYFVTKLTAVNADQSFGLFISGDGLSLTFRLVYNGGSYLYVDLLVPIATAAGGNWHHIVAIYNQAATSMTVVIDGKVVGYAYNTNLSARNNNANSKLTFGGYGNGTHNGSAIGSMADVFYKKSVMTLAQIRQVYVVGTKYQAYLDIASKVKINGENLGDYWIQYPIAVTGTNFTSTRAVAIPMKTEDGSPRLKGINIVGAISGGLTINILNLIVSGITFKSVGNYYQSINGYLILAAPVYAFTYVNPAASSITLSSATSAAFNLCAASGDLEIDSWPTWALDLSTLY